MPNPPDKRRAGAIGYDRKTEHPAHTASASAPQDLTCAGCGALGHAPVIVYDKSKAPPSVVLRPVFAWNDRTVLLCTDCRAAWQLNRASGRRAGR